MLDQQNADKSDQVRLKTQQESQIDRSTHTSLESCHHKWGAETSDTSRERAIFHELLATVDYRAQREREGREAEKKDAVRMAEEVEKRMAWEWHVRREEDKQEKERLACLWKAAASDRRKIEEAKKEAALREEKEVIRRMNQGMVPARRLRRPKEECIASQDAMPPSHRAAPLGPLKTAGAWQ